MHQIVYFETAIYDIRSANLWPGFLSRGVRDGRLINNPEDPQRRSRGHSLHIRDSSLSPLMRWQGAEDK